MTPNAVWQEHRVLFGRWFSRLRREKLAVLALLAQPMVWLALTFASSALVPLALMPGWMAAVARLNPMTYAINGVRTIVLSGWQAGPLLPIRVILASFDLACLMIAAATLRRGLR